MVPNHESSTRRLEQLDGHLKTPNEAIDNDVAYDRPQLSINYPVSKIKLDKDRCIDDVKPLRVAVVGAGLSGINAGILLPAKVPGIQLSIFEKNHDVVSAFILVSS